MYSMCSNEFKDLINSNGALYGICISTSSSVDYPDSVEFNGCLGDGNIIGIGTANSSSIEVSTYEENPTVGSDEFSLFLHAKTITETDYLQADKESSTTFETKLSGFLTSFKAKKNCQYKLGCQISGTGTIKIVVYYSDATTEILSINASNTALTKPGKTVKKLSLLKLTSGSLYSTFYIELLDEYLPMGIYKVVGKPVKNGELTTYKAYDRMYFLTQPYIPSFESLTGVTDGAVLDDIEEQTGIVINHLDSMTHAMTSLGTGTTTIREMIQIIACMNGACASFDRVGELNFIWYDEETIDYSVDSSRYYEDNLDLDTVNDPWDLQYIKCTKTTSDGSTEFVVGEGNGIEFECPIMKNYIMSEISNKVFGTTVRNCTIGFLGNPLLDLGDIVSVTPFNGTSCVVPVIQLQHAIKGGMVSQISAYAMSEDEVNGGGVVSSTSVGKAIDQLNVWVAGKVGNDEIISKINQSPESIDIEASKINLKGYTDINGYFTVGTDGKVAMKDANVEITGGSINIETSQNTNDIFKLVYNGYKFLARPTMIKLEKDSLFSQLTNTILGLFNGDGNNKFQATYSALSFNRSGTTTVTLSNLGTLTLNGTTYPQVKGNGAYLQLAHTGDSAEGVVAEAACFRPATDNKLPLGTSSWRWKQVYAVSSSISTSDRNKKKDIENISDKYLELFDKLQPVSYKMKDGVRTHIGFISQDVEQAMNELKMSSNDFAGFCKDQQEQSVYDEEGIVTPERKLVYDENGNPLYDYSLRYEEFIALNTAKIKSLEARVEQLESLVQELLNK